MPHPTLPAHRRGCATAALALGFSAVSTGGDSDQHDGHRPCTRRFPTDAAAAFLALLRPHKCLRIASLVQMGPHLLSALDAQANVAIVVTDNDESLQKPGRCFQRRALAMSA